MDKCEITPLACKKSQESDSRAALYIALTKSFDKPNTPQPNASESKKGENSLTERENLFGKTVADNLLQCDPKRLSTDKEKDIWSVLWLQTRKFDPKKYGNFMFPNVAGFQNYGYTDQTHVQQQNT